MSKFGEIGTLMSRNAPVGTNVGVADNYKRWLISKGGAGRRLTEIEKSFFAANGGSGRTHADLKSSFLAAKGFTGGSLNDRWRRFCASGTC